jgi:hypothetical protein
MAAQGYRLVSVSLLPRVAVLRRDDHQYEYVICHARIDYRFLTSCPHCGCEIKRADLPQSDPVSDQQLEEPVEPVLTWKQEAINVAHIFASSIAGMISGAVVVYIFVGVTYLALSPKPDPATSSCGWGTVLGFFSLISGAFLGTIGGSVLAVKRPLCKGVRMVRQIQ